MTSDHAKENSRIKSGEGKLGKSEGAEKIEVAKTRHNLTSNLQLRKLVGNTGISRRIREIPVILAGKNE